MRCLVCNSTDQWESVDEFRDKPAGMCICKTCGFVSYPSKWKTPEEIREHYRSAYRPPPTSSNVHSGQRKLFFHNAFLSSVMHEWKERGLKNPAIFEVGAAFGMALAWIRDMYKGALVNGSELTTSFKRVAFHEYGIRLQDDFDASKKYDLIMSYKVAEHQLDADLELKKYAECLNPGGYLYISVPVWFESMSNFGKGGFDLDYYYDPNHINVWTRKLFERVLKNAGFEIVKEDHVIYDSTYLCKKCVEPVINTDIENYQEVKTWLRKIKEAYHLFTLGNYEKAVDAWPNYPTAHINRAEGMRKKAVESGWEYIKEHIIDYGFKCCPGSIEIYAMAADWAMRMGLWSEAIKYIEKGLEEKPENPNMFLTLILVMRELAMSQENLMNNDAKIHYFTQAKDIAKHLRQVSLQHQREATDQVFFYSSLLPIPNA